jgi:hypothetical protein
VTLVEHNLKQDEQIEIGSSKMSQFQHIAESISLASAIATAHEVIAPEIRQRRHTDGKPA